MIRYNHNHRKSCKKQDYGSGRIIARSSSRVPNDILLLFFKSRKLMEIAQTEIVTVGA